MSRGLKLLSASLTAISQVVFDPALLRRATARNPDRIRIPRRKTAPRNSRFCAGFWTPAASSLSARSDGRRPESARARSRGKPGPRLGVERYGDFRLAACSMQARHRGRRDPNTCARRWGESEEASRAEFGGCRLAGRAWIALNRVERDGRGGGASAMEGESGGRRKSGS